MMSTCDEELHVDGEFASFGIPLGTIICKMGTVVELAVLLCFIAQTADLGFDLSWYVHLFIVSILYAIVVPPVPGGMIACLSLLLTELGLPGSMLALLTAMDIIIDYPCTGAGVVSDLLAVFSTAKSIGLVADEPTGNLDAETGQEIMELLYSICRAGITVLMSTHNRLWPELYPGKKWIFDKGEIRDGD
jgi:Na+/H+-dicarboxylate symporter